MPFKYRLEKVLIFRISKRDEQIEVVKAAEQEVIRIQNEIDQKKLEISAVKSNMYSAHHTMMEVYDNYIKHLYEVIEKLEEEKQEAIKKLEEEKEKLAELEKGVKVLEKHKERKKEEFLEEEKKAEMKTLDEIAGVKHYRQTQQRKADELEDELLEAEREFNQQYGQDYEY